MQSSIHSRDAQGEAKGDIALMRTLIAQSDEKRG